MRTFVLSAVLLVGLAGAARAEGLPQPVLDTEDLRIHQVPADCNQYLILCKKTGKFVVVDPGGKANDLIAPLLKDGRTLEAVWITHEHGDHLTGVGAVTKAHPVPVLAHAIAAKTITERRGLPVERVKALADGAEVKVGELTWKVMHLPGHSPGSLGFLLPGRVLVAGDVLFKGNIGRYDLQTDDGKVFAKSLARLWDLPDKVLVLPGHMATTTIGEEKKTNWPWRDLVRTVRSDVPAVRPWMGISIDQGYVGRGLGLRSVEPDSPAAKAGLKAGDAILRMDGDALSGVEDLLAVIRRHKIGDTVPMRIKSGDEYKEIQLTFGAKPAPQAPR